MYTKNDIIDNDIVNDNGILFWTESKKERKQVGQLELMMSFFGSRSLWWFISPRRVYNILRFLWVLVNNCYVIPAYFVWLLLFSPLLLINSSAFWKIEDVLFGWLLNMVACWNYTAGYHVVESGDRLEKNTTENVLFMPNHQSTADVPLCMTLFTAREHFADRVMWIMDRVFKYSNFGCVSWMHDDFFILAVS